VSSQEQAGGQVERSFDSRAFHQKSKAGCTLDCPRFDTDSPLSDSEGSEGIPATPTSKRDQSNGSADASVNAEKKGGARSRANIQVKEVSAIRGRRPARPARPALKERSNWLGDDLQTSSQTDQAGLSKSLPGGGLLRELLGGSNGLANTRGGQSFSRWSAPEQENGTLSADQKLEGGLVVERPTDRLEHQLGPCSSTVDSSAHNTGASASLRPTYHKADAKKDLKRNQPKCLTRAASPQALHKAEEETEVRLSPSRVVHDQVLRTSFYAGSRFLSRKHVSFSGFAKPPPEQEVPDSEVQVGSGPGLEAVGKSGAESAVHGATVEQNGPRTDASGQAGATPPQDWPGKAGCEMEHCFNLDKRRAACTEIHGSVQGKPEAGNRAEHSAAAGGEVELLKNVQSVSQQREQGEREIGLLRAEQESVRAAPRGPLDGLEGVSCSRQDAEETKAAFLAPSSGLRDGASIEARLVALTVPQLKRQLEGRGLICRGRKQELVTRLGEAILAEGISSNWQESLGAVDAGGWGNPSRVLKRKAKPAPERQRDKDAKERGRRRHSEEGKGVGGGPKGIRQVGGPKRKRAASAKVEKRGAEVTTSSDSTDGEMRVLSEGAERRLRVRGEKGSADQDAVDLGTESDRSFDSNDLSDSDDDYAPQAAEVQLTEEMVEGGADGPASEGDSEGEGEKETQRGKRKRGVSRVAGTKRSRSEVGAAEETGAGSVKRAGCAKRRAELQAVGWGGPVRTSKSGGRAAGKFSSAGLPVRDNFVRQNLNGRGGGRKRFTNGARAGFKSKSGSRPFRRNFSGKSRRGGKRGPGPRGQGSGFGGGGGQDGYGGEDGGQEEQPGLFKNEGWLPGTTETRAKATEEGGREPCYRPSATAQGTQPPSASIEKSLPVTEPPGAKEGVSGGGQWQGDEETKAAVQAALAEPSEANLVAVLRQLFGFAEFREGQLAAIQRVLQQRSTMLVLPTGGGKSLCYQVRTRACLPFP
jgi:hypothetical protein